MIPLRKARAGSCNLGYTWPSDGSVVQVTPEHAAALLAIPDGDFSEVEEPEAAEEPQVAIEEPAPEARISESPPPRRAPAKKATAKQAEVAPPAAVEE